MGISHSLSCHPVESLKTPPLQPKVGKRRPWPQTAVPPLMAQVGQERTWPSCSGLEVAPSKLLWEILTEERLIILGTDCTNSRGTPVISESTPFGCLLFWSFKESINSLVLVPNFPNQTDKENKDNAGHAICRLGNQAVPDNKPNWDHRDNREGDGKQRLTRYKNMILKGIQASGKKRVNWNKKSIRSQ